MQTAADAIAKDLADAGRRHVFGVPGGEVLVALGALKRIAIAFAPARNANATVFMTEGM